MIHSTLFVSILIRIIFDTTQLFDVTFLLRNKNVTSALLLKRTHSIPSPLPLVENRTLKLSPSSRVYAKKAIMVFHQKAKKRIRLSDIY